MDIKDFIAAHFNDDTDKLLLQADRYPDTDVPFAVDQIIARRQIREKLPEWFANPEVVFPSRISTEQCSSELTARYKQRLLRGEKVCDLTGGLGIDCWSFSQKAKEVIYVERFPEYCQAAENNFNVLKVNHIHVINGDSQELTDTLNTDTFYIDPARRSGCNKRLFALTDCEPDVLQLKPLLLEQAQRLIIKISPMADISETLRLLPETSEIHVLSVRNECKELLFVLDRESVNEPDIYTINYNSDGEEESFRFKLPEEKEAILQTGNTVRKYLYEPNSSLLKSGAFKLVASRFNMVKLHQHSHLYTSDSYVADFPGRIFNIEEVYEFSGKLLKQLSKVIPKANITIRNFPMTVAEIRKRSGIKEGGDAYLFGTTTGNNKKVILYCHKAEKH